MLNNSIKNLTIGALGLGVSTTVHAVEDFSPDAINNLVTLIVQILIGFTTLFKLLKKNNNG